MFYFYIISYNKSLVIISIFSLDKFVYYYRIADFLTWNWTLDLDSNESLKSIIGTEFGYKGGYKGGCIVVVGGVKIIFFDINRVI